MCVFFGFLFVLWFDIGIRRFEDELVVIGRELVLVVCVWKYSVFLFLVRFF